jgi:hypothetical protein
LRKRVRTKRRTKPKKVYLLPEKDQAHKSHSEQVKGLVFQPNRCRLGGFPSWMSSRPGFVLGVESGVARAGVDNSFDGVDQWASQISNSSADRVPRALFFSSMPARDNAKKEGGG